MKQAQELQPPEERAKGRGRSAAHVDRDLHGAQQNRLGLGVLVGGDERRGGRRVERERARALPARSAKSARSIASSDAPRSRATSARIGGAVEAIRGVERGARGARAHEHVASNGLRDRRRPPSELAAILDELHQAVLQSMLPRPDVDA